MSQLDAITARRRFVVLTALRWLRVGPIVAVLVVLLQHHGLTLAQVGGAFAAYGAATFLLELPTGGLADTMGTRPVMLMAVGVDVVATVPLLTGGPTWSLLVAAALLGCGRALSSGPLEAWYVGHARADDPHADIRIGLSRGGVAEALALAAGALVGGYGGRLVATPLGLDPLQVPVVTSLVGHLVFAAAVLRLVSPRPRHLRAGGRLRARVGEEIRQVPAVVRETLHMVRRSPDLARLLGVAVAAAIPLIVTEVLWQPAVADHWVGARTRTDLLGLLAAGIFVAAALGSWAAPRVGAWFGRRLGRAVTVLVVLQAVAVVALGLAPALATFTIAFLAAYLLGGVWFPLHQELIHDRVTDDRRATVLSTMSLGIQVGNVATQVTLVPLAAATSRATSWSVAAGIAVLGALGVVRLSTRRPPSLEAGPTDDVVAPAPGAMAPH